MACEIIFLDIPVRLDTECIVFGMKTFIVMEVDVTWCSKKTDRLINHCSILSWQSIYGFIDALFAAQYMRCAGAIHRGHIGE